MQELLTRRAGKKRAAADAALAALTKRSRRSSHADGDSDGSNDSDMSEDDDGNGDDNDVEILDDEDDQDDDDDDDADSDEWKARPRYGVAKPQSSKKPRRAKPKQEKGNAGKTVAEIKEQRQALGLPVSLMDAAEGFEACREGWNDCAAVHPKLVCHQTIVRLREGAVPETVGGTSVQVDIMSGDTINVSVSSFALFEFMCGFANIIFMHFSQLSQYNTHLLSHSSTSYLTRHHYP